MSENKHAKDKFTPDDDSRLREIVEKIGTKNWTKVANLMGNKNSRQCHDRWTKYLDPEVNLSPFSVEEDILLLQLYKEMGPKWVAISKFLPGRKDVSVKARYRVLKRRRITIELLKRYPNMVRRRNQRKKPQVIHEKNAEIPNYEQEIFDFYNFENFDELIRGDI